MRFDLKLIKITDKLILKPFLKLFILALVSTLFVIVLQTFLTFLNDFIGKGLGLGNYILLATYISSAALPHALPMTIMFSSIMTIGNLSESLELVVLKAAGFSLARIIRSLIIFSLSLSIFAFYVNSYIVPRAAVKSINLLSDMRQKKPDVSIKEGIFYDGIPGYSIRIGKRDRQNDAIHDIMIYDHTKKDIQPSLTISQNGRIYLQDNARQLVIELNDGHNYIDIKPSDDDLHADIPTNFVRTNFKLQRLIIGLDSLQFSRTKEEIFEKSRRAKNRKKLKEHILTMIKSQEEVRGYITQNFDKHFHDLEKISTQESIVDTTLKETDNVFIIKKFIEQYKLNPLELSVSSMEVLQVCQDAVKDAKIFRDYIERCAQHDYNIMVDKNSYEIELYKMFTWAISCLTVMLLGASLGAIMRKGGLGLPLIISGFLIVIHYVIEIITEKWAKYGLISTINSAWAANYVLIPVALVIYIFAYKDTRIFETNLYSVILNKFRKKKSAN
jgi:lipopolysaccharide export system permease protein